MGTTDSGSTDKQKPSSSEGRAPVRPFDLAALLSRADPFLRTLVDALAEGVVVQGADLSVIAGNPAAERIMGLSVSEMLSRGPRSPGWHLLRPDGARLRFSEAAPALALESNHPVHRQLVGVERPDKSVTWILVNSVPLCGPNEQKPYAVVTTFGDVTHSHTLESELHQARRMESIGRLAGGIAHDFNNLLAVMMSALDSARQATPQNADLQEELVTANESAERARQLTRQLLAFARRQPILLSELDLNELVRDLARLLKQLLGHAELSLTLEPAIWKISADPTQLERVVLNLAANARDAMPEGGTFSLSTQNLLLTNTTARPSLPAGRYVVLTARDTGVGMREEVRERLFEPFFTTKPDGNGLGLASSYGLVRQLGGDIEVESKPFAGSTFRVFLPAASARESDPK